MGLIFSTDGADGIFFMPFHTRSTTLICLVEESQKGIYVNNYRVYM